MARKPSFFTFLNNFVKNPNNLLYVGGALVLGYVVMKNLGPSFTLFPAPPSQPVLTKTQMATDDGSTWTYGNVQNDDVAPGAGPEFAKGIAHNRSILDQDLDTPDSYHVPEVANVYDATITPSHNYATAAIPSNSGGSMPDFDTNNEIVEVVDYSP